MSDVTKRLGRYGWGVQGASPHCKVNKGQVLGVQFKAEVQETHAVRARKHSP